MKLYWLLALVSSLIFYGCEDKGYRLLSPNDAIELGFYMDDAGVPRYFLCYKNDTVIAPSKLGIHFEDNPMDTLLELRSVDIANGKLPYDFSESRFLDDEATYNELTAHVRRDGREMQIIFRLYDDGLALRYFVRGYENVSIVGDVAEVRFPNDVSCFWSERKGVYADMYYKSSISELAPVFQSVPQSDPNYGSYPDQIYLNFPLLVDTNRGKYLNFQRVTNIAKNLYALRFDPYRLSFNATVMPDEGSDRRVVTLPSYSEWLVMGLSDSSEKLLESEIAYHLAIEEEISEDVLDHPISLYQNVCYNNVILPFSRHYAGREEVPTVDIVRGAQSTLAHQLGLHVVFNRPISDYDGDKMSADDTLHLAYEYVGSLPEQWSEMRVLEGKLGDYVVVARKDAVSSSWYVGGVSDERARKIKLTFDFLDPDKLYEARFYVDSPSADFMTNMESYELQHAVVRKGNTFSFDTAPGGGFALSFKEIK